MNKRLGDFSIRNLIISYVILYSIMPIVQRLTSRFFTAYFYLAVVVALVILILVLDRPENLSIYGTFLLPFIIYGVLTFFYPHEDFFVWGYQTLLSWLPVILGYYFTQDSSQILKTYSKLIVLAIVITMITTIIGCIRNPYAARILATVDSRDANAFAYDMQNIGGYNFVYIMILLYPILILSYKTRKLKLLPSVFLTIIILLVVVYSEYTTALLLFVITSFLFLAKRNLSAKGIIILAISAILLILLFSNVITDFLLWLGDIVGSQAIHSRLDALAGGKNGLENFEDNRLELYRMSLNMFWTNPLFGTLFESYKMNGGHSFILDNLASYGLLGGALMFSMYARVFTRFYLPFKEKAGYGYVVWTFVQAVILSIVNTGMWLEVLCLFVPILLHWIYRTEGKKDEVTVDSELAAGSTG